MENMTAYSENSKDVQKEVGYEPDDKGREGKARFHGALLCGYPGSAGYNGGIIYDGVDGSDASLYHGDRLSSHRYGEMSVLSLG